MSDALSHEQIEQMIELIQKIKRELGMLQVGSLAELQKMLGVDSIEVVLNVLRYMEDYHRVYTLYTDMGLFLIASAPTDPADPGGTVPPATPPQAD